MCAMDFSLDSRTRELLVCLVMDLRDADMRAQVYRTILESTEQHPEIVANWRGVADNMIKNPDPVVQEHLDAKCQPLVDYALRGLSQAEAQALLDRVARMYTDVQ